MKSYVLIPARRHRLCGSVGSIVLAVGSIVLTIGLGLGSCALHAQAGPSASTETLSLRSAIEEGLRGPAAQVFQGQADQVTAAIRQARLRPNPRLFLQSEDLRPWDSTFSLADDSESYIYAGQIFELAGKRGKRVAFAQANANRAEADAELQRRQLAGRIAVAYWSYAAARAAVDLHRQNLQSAGEVVRYHQARVNAGAMRGVDLLRMQLEEDRARMDLQTAEVNANMARLTLLREMGRRITTSEPQLADPLAAIDPVADKDAEAAIAERPDVVAAKRELDAATANARLQRANGVPDPDVVAGYKRNVGSNTLYTSLQIPLPIFNRNQGEVGRADASVRTAQAALAQSELVARSEIAAARGTYEKSLVVVQQIMPDMQMRARRHLAILDDAYRAGGLDLLRYIDARRLAVEVELGAYQRLAEYHASAVRLQLAYGERP